MATLPELLVRHGKLLVAGIKLRCGIGTLKNCGVFAVVNAAQVWPLKVEQATLMLQSSATCPAVVAPKNEIENEQITIASPE